MEDFMKSKKNKAKILIFVLVCIAQCCLLAACSKPASNVKDSESNAVTATEAMATQATETEGVKAAYTDSKLEDANAKNKENPDAISIKYIGNSCFFITFADGTRLVTDPYVGGWNKKGQSFPKTDVDAMTISHTHSDHTSGKFYFTGEPQVLNPQDVNKTVTVGDVTITGYTSKHVAGMGDSTIFVYEENGLKVVHMGETDNIDSQEAKDAVKDADVILAYAGEYGDVQNKDSFQTLMNDLNIKVLIPQHYSLNADHLVYNQPAMETILTELPAGTPIVKTDEFFVVKDLDKQFVEMPLMKIE